MKLRKITALFLVITLMSIPVELVQASGTGTDHGKHNIEADLGAPLVNENIRLQSVGQPSYKNYKTIPEAATQVRDKILEHSESASAYIVSTSADYLNVFETLQDEIFKETDRADTGDYMRWDIDREYPSFKCKVKKSGKTTYYYYTFNFEFVYFTTLEQKRQVSEKVSEIINSFNFTSETTDYDKIKAVYDYVCENVAYAKDETQDIVYTSWSALFQKEAVCQGYAQLMYAFLKQMGISTRLIPGYGVDMDVNHGWNIVKLGDYYYNIDATWDADYAAAKKPYEYFLKGDNFPKHTRMEEYTTSEFYLQYPMAANDYGVGEATESLNSRRAVFSVIKPKFKSVSRKKVKLIKVAGAKKYQIKYSTDRAFKKGNKTVTTKSTTYKFKKLKKDTKYYVEFRAYKKIGGVKTYTMWSKIKKIKKN